MRIFFMTILLVIFPFILLAQDPIVFDGVVENEEWKLASNYQIPVFISALIC